MLDLDAKELEVVLQTLNGEKQKDIAKKLDIDLSTVHRILKRRHVQEALARGAKTVFTEGIEKIISTYDACLDRVKKEINTMPINSVISAMNHFKAVISKFQIEASHDMYKELKRSEHVSEIIQIHYSDTNKQKDEEIKDILRRYGVPEEEYKNDYFGH